MKRIVLGVLAAGIILTIGATTAFAAGVHGGRARGAETGICLSDGACSMYVDADEDGICDNCASDHGVCLNNGNCDNYADADGDGICDNCASGHSACLNSGSCGNYVDADGDGVCDNQGAHCEDSAAWSGMGHHGSCQGECRGSLCGANRR